MSSIVFELLVLFLLVLLNGAFALSELAVMSARKVRLQEWASAQRPGARAALELAESPDRFLSTVQVGITLIGVLAGAIGGATLSSVLTEELRRIPVLRPYADALGLGTIVLLITYLSLVLGELVPKQIALRNPERAASLVAAPMRGLSRLTAPLVALLTLSTNAVMRLLGVPPNSDPPITEDELRILLKEGTRAGVFRRSERDMVESIFELDDRHVSTVMTPYTEIIWLDIDDSPESIRTQIETSGHARYPVSQGTLDNVLGIVYAQSLLARLLAGQPLDLRSALHPALVVPGNARATSVIDMLKHNREHLVLVVDEHGAIEGLLTKHDLLEAIVGYIPTAHDSGAPTPVQSEDGTWLLDGLMPIEQFKELFKRKDPLPGEDRNTFATLGGFVMRQLGAIPTQGDIFEWDGLSFTVTIMDGRRVEQVRVTHSENSSPAMQPQSDPGI